MRNTRRGLSLVELLVVISMIVMGLGLTLSNRTAPHRQTPQAVAGVFAEACRAAQQLARARGMPVSLAIPGAGGTCCSSQSFYLQEGDVFPRVTKVTNLAREYPQAYLSVVSWGPVTEWNCSNPKTGVNFSIDAWSSRYPNDYALIFLPDGQVVSNGLPHRNGNYYVVVSSGIEVTAGAAPPGDPGVTPTPAPFALQRVASPVTVSISQRGAVDVVAGVPDLPAGSVVGNLGPPALAAAPPPTKLSDSAPEVLSVTTVPASLDAGQPVLISEASRLTLRVKAWSPEGLPLTSTWSGPGVFSAGGTLPLRWNGREGYWIGEVDWVPPAGLTPGQQVELTCQVQDEFGHEAAQVNGGSLNLSFRGGSSSDGQLLFTRSVMSPDQRAGSSNMWTSNADGSGLKEIAGMPEGGYSPRWSPDGSKIVFSTGSSIQIVTAEGTLVSDLGPGYNPTWSPDGTRVAYTFNGDLFVVNANGEGKANLTNRPPGTNSWGANPAFVRPRWSGDGQSIVSGRSDYSYGVTVINLASGTQTRIKTPSSSYYFQPSFSSDGQWVAWYGFYDAWIAHPDGTGITKVWDHARTGGGIGWGGQDGLEWSPDNRQISWVSSINPEGSQIKVVDVVSKTQVGAMPGNSYPNWSPTENKIVYQESAVDATGNQHGYLTTSAPDGSNKRHVVEGAYQASWKR